MANAKLVLSFGYTKYVVDADKGLIIMQALQGAEKYEEFYKDGNTSRHIYDDLENGGVNLTATLLTDSFYKMAKLAGKPDRK